MDKGLIVVGLGAVAAFFFIGVPYIKRRALEKAEADKERTQEIVKLIELADERIEVKGSQGLLAALALTGIMAPFVMAARMQPENPVGIVFALVIGLITFVAWMRALSRFGQPRLVLSREGVTAAGYGLIPWKAIYGVHLEERSHRGITVRTLALRVPNLVKLTDQMHAFERFLFKLRLPPNRKILRIGISQASERPKVIHEAAVALWSKKTGRGNVNPEVLQKVTRHEKAIELRAKVLGVLILAVIIALCIVLGIAKV